MKILKSKLIPMAGLLLCFTAANSGLQAGFYDTVMESIDDEFARADNKLAVITKPMDLEYTSGFSKYRNGLDTFDIPFLRDDSIIDNTKLYPSNAVDPWDRTNPLALAICKADVERVEKFLKVIENPNDPALLVRGHRQVYNLVCLSADPVWPLHENHDLKDRLKIIDLLGATKFDFNFRPKWEDHYSRNYNYSNPPLVLASAIHGGGGGIIRPEGRYRNPDKAVKARLMLYGADPKIKGSTPGHEHNLGKLAKLALDQILTENLTNIHPTEYVKELLEEAKQEQITKEYKKFEEFKARMNNLKF